MNSYRFLTCSILLMSAAAANAFSWQDLWKSKNQQAQAMMQKQDFANAKKTFTNENWRAVAAFRANDYKLAADLFAQSNSEESNYNLGNSLANLGQYQAAIKAYDKALSLNKDNQDAKYNKEIVQKLLDKQQQQKPPEQQSGKNDQQEQQKQNDQGTKSDPDAKSNSKPNTNENSEPKHNQEPSKPKSKKPEDKQKDAATQNSTENVDKQSSGAKQQMKEQWLKLIPDDPGGLLREKFRRDYLRKRGELNS